MKEENAPTPKFQFLCPVLIDLLNSAYKFRQEEFNFTQNKISNEKRKKKHFFYKDHKRQKYSHTNLDKGFGKD